MRENGIQRFSSAMLTIALVSIGIIALGMWNVAQAGQLVMVTPSAMNFRTEPSADSEQMSDCPNQVI